MYEIWKGDQLILVTLSHNKKKSWGKDFVCYKHNHTLEYLDTIKVNSMVKNTVATEVAKGYRPNDISRNIKIAFSCTNLFRASHYLFLFLSRLPDLVALLMFMRKHLYLESKV